ncbi:hypothetical protein GCM10009808_22210 [Microbacterium sediminicola]|uniref:HTH tetR-type domain-containing protein n=1 Tax=Microbacterium sediminicola TaxID=415210 RepID=A0ABP4UHN6_9MICO
MAFRLLETAPFDAITIELIAAGAEVSPSSIYRYFGTKEAIFLWDEYDDDVVGRFRQNLATSPPGQAMLDAVTGAMPSLDLYGSTAVLTRARAVAAVPQLRAARANHHERLRHSLGSAMVEHGWPDAVSSTFAGAVIGAFTGALAAWERPGSDSDLTAALARAAEFVKHLDRAATQRHSG